MKNLRGIPKDLKRVFREAEKHGWNVRRRPNSHFVLEGPQGQKVWCSATPSDAKRVIKNIKRDLSKAGLDLM